MADLVASDKNMVDLGAELYDYADTAAVIAGLDLVLCVDTSVAHLAGALGKPVWLMLAAPGRVSLAGGTRGQPVVSDDEAVPPAAAR